MPKGGGDGWHNSEEETVVQAVLLADSFNVRFAPLTFSRPRALLPLANVALIDYTLELLVASGVHEIYIFCRSFASEIKAHIESSIWKSNPNVKIETRVIQSYSVGECLRECDTMDVIKGDFVLVSGDIVSNMDLEKAIAAHSERSKKNKDIVMSMFMKETEPGHYLQSREDDLVVAIDSDNILQAYSHSEDSRYEIKRAIFENARSVDIRCDLVDCHLYICSPKLLMLFTDEFDCQDMKDFITFIHSQEIADHCIHTEVIRDGYAARVGNLHTYDAVSMDVLRRWTYPLVPDGRLLQREQSIQYKRHNVYLSAEVGLTWGCELEENVLVGFASTVGREGAPTTTLTNCIIGKRCKIGAGVRISNSYVWDDVVIGDGCTIDRSILADKVELKAEVSLQPGSVLGPGVVIDASRTISINTKISLETCSAEDAGDFDEDEGKAEETEIEGEWDVDVVGPGGKGKVWEPDDEDDVELFAWGCRGSERPPLPPFGADEDETEAEEDFGTDDDTGREFSGASSTGLDDAGPDDGDFDGEILDLIRERVIAKFDAGQEDSLPLSELALESQGSRSAHNKTLNDVVHAMVHAVMQCSNADTSSTQQRVQRIKNIFVKISPVLSKYITTATCQRLFIESLESASIVFSNSGDAFQTVLHAMYEEDLVLEEIILRWHSNAQMAVLSGKQQAIRKRVQPFIEWLQSAEEESEDESDSD